jgi:hypothetical protein
MEHLGTKGTASSKNIAVQADLPTAGAASNVHASRTVTSNYAVTMTDDRIYVNAAGGNVTITLPLTLFVTGEEFLVKRIDNSANTVAITPALTASIEGAASLTLAAYASVNIAYDGSNWWVI